MSAKILVILMLILIVGSLFSALVFLFRNKEGSDDRTVKALTLRISLSLVLFLLLMAGYYFGLIPKQGM